MVKKFRQLTISKVAIKYDINTYTARDYMRMYRDKNHLSPRNENPDNPKPIKKKCSIDYNDLSDLSLQVVVSDRTAFWCNDVYYELTLYMDLFNNEIISYDLSSKKGDRTTYINGLNDLIEKKKEYKDLKLILHTDQGSVYSSKAFNEATNYIISFILCLERVLLLIMVLWKLLMVGLKKNYSMILILNILIMLNLLLMNIFSSLITQDHHFL